MQRFLFALPLMLRGDAHINQARRKITTNLRENFPLNIADRRWQNLSIVMWKKSKGQGNVPCVHGTVKLQQGYGWTPIMSCLEMNAHLPFLSHSLLLYLVKLWTFISIQHSYALPPRRTWPTHRWAGRRLHLPSRVSAGPALLLGHNQALSPVQWSRKEQISVLQWREDENKETETDPVNKLALNECTLQQSPIMMCRCEERRHFNRSQINRSPCFSFDCLNLG